MKRRWNLATLIGLALLLLASTTAAAGISEEQETVTGAVPGKKFCLKWIDDNGTIEQVLLSQESSSYDPQGGNYSEPNDSYVIYHYEQCFDLWYDASAESGGMSSSSSSESSSSTNDVYTFFTEIGGYGLEHIDVSLESDIDFGGVTADSSSCVASFKPIAFMRFASFLGNGKTISNLCYIVDWTNSDVGFISEANDVYFYNVNFENVYFKVTSSNPASEVMVGVAMGSLMYSEFGAGIGSINLKNVKIVAARAGGVVGHVSNSAIAIRGISGENVEIAATTGALPTTVGEYASTSGMNVYLGGVVARAESGVFIDDVGITGLNVHSDYDFYEQEQAPPCASSMAPVEEWIGGLVGLVRDGAVAISNTYTVGNISIPEGALASNGRGKIGFVAGSAVLNASEGYVIGNNYHYGESDYLASDLLGYISVDGTSYGTGSSSWIEVSVNSGFKPGGHNYRNAIEGHIEATSGLAPPNYQIVLAEASNYGGYLDPQYMKVGEFANNLNNRIGMLKEDDLYSSSMTFALWSRKDGVNDGLPVFANENLKPIYSIDFMASDEIYSNLSSTDKQKWVSAGAEVNSDGASLTVLTDYTGKLSNSSWQTAAAAMAADSYYWSYLDDKTGKNVSYSVKASSTFNANIGLSLLTRTSVVVRHGFVDWDENEGDYFIPVEDFFSEQDGFSVYFMGTPATTINSDSSWTKIPYLAAYDEATSTQEYYGFYLATKHCEEQGQDDDGNMIVYCTFNSVQTSGSGRLYVDALGNLSNGDTLYVVYEQEALDAAGGYLYVSDLHGEYFDLDKANVKMFGVKVGGDLDQYGEPSYLEIQSTDSRNIEGMLNGAYSIAMSLPYSPYLRADYPPDLWNNVDGVVAMVVVGRAYDSQGDDSPLDLMKYATQAISYRIYEYSDFQDTLTALESPTEIRAKMDANAGQSFVYARLLRSDKDGNLDLTNLFAAVESVRQTDYDYPIYVGFLPQISDMIYHVSFDVEANVYAQDEYYNPLFVANPWLEYEGIPDATYTNENKDEYFFNSNDWHLVKTDGCYSGAWSFWPAAERGNDELEIERIVTLEYQEVYNLNELPIVKNDDGSRSFTLYTYWETNPEYCLEMWPRRVQWDEESESQVWDNAIIEDKSKLGNIVLQQVWNGDTLRHKSVSLDGDVTGIIVPRAEELSYTFEVLGEGMPGYELNSDITFRYLDRSQQTNGDGSVVTKKLKDGDVLTIAPAMYENMEFSAKFVLKTYNVVFVPEQENVLYGKNSPREGTYKLKDEEDAIDLPVWVYTADRCVAGWVPSSISEELEGMNELGDYIWDEYLAEEEEAWWGYSQFDFELSTYLDEMAKYDEGFEGTYSLYGFWVPAKLCVQEFSYKQAKLTAENGTVQFKELLKDSDGKVTGSQVHSFAKDGTMLLPYGTKADNNYVVVSVPNDGYVLDSLVMNVGGTKTTYHEGDTLSGDIYKATFTAYFVEDNQIPMEFVKMDLQPSGNAVRLELSTTEFRAGGAQLRVTLENNDGKKLVDTLLAKTITKTPYSGEWEYYPLAAGTYLVTATLIRGKETFVLEKDFEVKAEIASVEDGWRMISLANVDMDSVAWKGDDAKFFWWDETSPFGIIWQYQEFKQGDKVDPLVGYWYSSLSGRSLVTRKDAYTPKNPVAWKLDSLYSGWNLVANPYGWYVNLYGENSASKKGATEKPDVEFLSWNDSLGSYEPVSVVGPNEAVWVQVDGPRTWKLPAKPEYVGLVDEEGETSVVKPLKKTVEVGTFGKNRWAIRAVLSDAKGKRDGWNILGVSETAWNSEEPPAGMGDRVNLSIMEGKKGLAKSFKKASGDSYEWTISLDASGNRMGFLHFEGIRALNAEGLKVFVTVDGETTQMNEGDTLKVALGSMAKTATVRVAPSARVTVAQKLDGLRALHTGSGLQVSFNVSESLAGQRTRVELLDTKGKVLSSASGKAVSGSNSMQVDTPKSGLYMVRVRVGSKQAVVNVLVK